MMGIVNKSSFKHQKESIGIFVQALDCLLEHIFQRWLSVVPLQGVIETRTAEESKSIVSVGPGIKIITVEKDIEILATGLLDLLPSINKVFSIKSFSSFSLRDKAAFATTKDQVDFLANLTFDKLSGNIDAAFGSPIFRDFGINFPVSILCICIKSTWL